MARRREYILSPSPGVDYNVRTGRRGRPRRDMRLPCSIIYCIDYRGPRDDQLTFMFRGCSDEHLRRVFDFLVIGTKYGIASGYRLECQMEEHVGVIRHAVLHHRCHQRLLVTPMHPNMRMFSIDDMCLLIEERLHAEWPCQVQRITVNKFINE